ncbi:MAG TPA: FAD-binding protein, partial [Trueperaceae bacterium]|nr:FAD-binding protein [Trueperaceae bacterium]
MIRAHKFDVIVVGAGGAGLMAARYAAHNPK